MVKNEGSSIFIEVMRKQSRNCRRNSQSHWLSGLSSWEAIQMYFKTLLELENLSHPHWSIVFRLKWRGSKIRNDQSNGDLFESQSKASSLFSSFLITQPWLIELTTLSPLFLSYAEDRLHWLPKPSAQFPQHFLYWYIVVHFQTDNLISKVSARKINNAGHIPIPGCWRLINCNRIKFMGWPFL